MRVYRREATWWGTFRDTWGCNGVDMVVVEQARVQQGQSVTDMGRELVCFLQRLWEELDPRNRLRRTRDIILSIRLFCISSEEVLLSLT